MNSVNYRHKRTRGVYKVLVIGRMTDSGQQMVIYQSIESNRVWVRSYDEFFDGRFEEVTS